MEFNDFNVTIPEQNVGLINVTFVARCQLYPHKTKQYKLTHSQIYIIRHAVREIIPKTMETFVNIPTNLFFQVSPDTELVLDNELEMFECSGGLDNQTCEERGCFWKKYGATNCFAMPQIELLISIKLPKYTGETAQTPSTLELYSTLPGVKGHVFGDPGEHLITITAHNNISAIQHTYVMEIYRSVSSLTFTTNTTDLSMSAVNNDGSKRYHIGVPINFKLLKADEWTVLWPTMLNMVNSPEMSWLNARGDCQRKQYSADLTVFRNQAEFQLLKQYVATKTSATVDAFIGVKNSNGQPSWFNSSMDALFVSKLNSCTTVTTGMGKYRFFGLPECMLWTTDSGKYICQYHNVLVETKLHVVGPENITKSASSDLIEHKFWKIGVYKITMELILNKKLSAIQRILSDVHTITISLGPPVYVIFEHPDVVVISKMFRISVTSSYPAGKKYFNYVAIILLFIVIQQNSKQIIDHFIVKNLVLW